jgi:HEAT repeat protein
MHTTRTIWMTACTTACIAALSLGACEDGGAKKHTRSTATTRTAKPAPDAEIITPNDPGPSASSSKITPLNSNEKASLREKALTLLANTAQAGNPEERANALESLVQTPARLSGVAETALQDQNVAVRAVAAMAVGKAKLANLAPRVRPLLQDESPFVRAAAIFALKRCGQNVDPSPLAGYLFEPDPRLRAHAAYILGELGEKSAIGPLRDAHREQSSRSNPSAVKISDLQLCEARVKLGDETALADIRTALYPAKPEDLEGAVLAIQIVGQVKDTASTNRLIELTATKDHSGQDIPGEIRVAAATSLAKLGQPQGSYIAREYFRGGKEVLRAQSANLFGETQRPENLQLVSQLLDDPDGRVRVAAAAAVVKITDR